MRISFCLCVDYRKVKEEIYLSDFKSSHRNKLKVNNTYLTGVVAPEPPLDEHPCALPCIGDGNSLPPEFACAISHESTNCRVAFLQKDTKIIHPTSKIPSNNRWHLPYEVVLNKNRIFI